jgi:hypothetical protein
MSISDIDTLAPSHAVPERYPVNLRITIPFYPRFLFVTLIVGSEKRGPSRLRSERGRYPVRTWGNVLVVTMALGVAAVAALFASLVASAL